MAVKNVGKSPALDVSIQSKAITLMGQTVSLSAVIKDFCDEVRERQLKQTNRGEVLFPDDTIPQGHGLLSTKDDIAANEKSLTIGFFSLAMLVCIDYRSTITNKRHSTGLAFLVLQTPKEPGGFPSLLPTGKGTLPIDILGVARAPFGSYAD